MMTALLLTTFLFAQDKKELVGPDEPVPKPVKVENLKRTMIPMEAYSLALEDLKRLESIDPSAQLFTRYIWIPNTTKERHAAVALTMNYISRASTLISNPMSKPMANGTIYRLDLREYAPRVIDLQQWLEVWENLQFDPSSALFITKDIIDLVLDQPEDKRPKVRVKASAAPAKKEVPAQFPAPVRRRVLETKTENGIDMVRVAVPEYKGKDGKTYTGEWIKKSDYDKEPLKEFVGPIQVVIPGPIDAGGGFITESLEAFRGKDIQVIRANGDHIPDALFTEVQDRTGSLAPVVEYRYFVFRALSTIKDKGLYSAIYGGLYYEFRGIRTAKEAGRKKSTDLDVLLEDLGLADPEHGENSEKLFDRLKSDQRTIMKRSMVTGKPRIVYYLPTLATRPGTASFVAITLDVRDQDIDVKSDPFRNLLKPSAFVSEVIFIGRNGLPGIGLFSAVNGDRQDFVPPDVAADREIPTPNTPILSGMYSCMNCHACKGHSFFIPAPNEIIKFLDDGPPILGDTSDRNKTISETQDRLKGLFLGDTDELFFTARRNHEKNVLLVTGPAFEGKGKKDLTDISMVATQEIVNIYNSYRYSMVNAKQALEEMGFLANDNKTAVEYMKLLLLPDPQAAIYGINPFDPTLGALKNKHELSVQRVEWDLVKTYACVRSQQVLKALPPKETKK